MRRVPTRELLVAAAAFAAAGLSACKSAPASYGPASPSTPPYQASKPAGRPFRAAPIRTASATPAPAPAPVAAPAPASTASAAPVASAPCVNATCPVLVGNPVNPGVTTSWNGKTVGFCCAACRAKFEASPARFVANLPGGSGSASDPAKAPTVSRAAPVSRAVPPPVRTSVARIVAPESSDVALKAMFVPAAVVAPVSVPAAKATVAPIVIPQFGSGDPYGEDCEGEGECVGGSCRVPGAPR